MNLRLLVALAVALAASSAGAQTRDPQWLKRPKAEDLVAVWPREAWNRGQGGRAVIECQITVQGALTACKVLEETPAGSGFGQAAIALTPQFLMRPKMVDGQPVTSSVRIPINFADIGRPTGSFISGPPANAGITRRVATSAPWREAPSVAQVAAAYPEKAKAARAAGRATLDCRINKDGKLANCNTLTEEPKGMGFAHAARGLAPLFSVDLSGEAAALAGADVHVPFSFSPEMIDAARPVIGKPVWTSLPTGEDVAGGFPAAARTAGVKTGRIRLRCVIGAEGRLDDCGVASEEPAGYGFGDAGRQLTQSFRMSLWTAEGLPTRGGAVVIPLRYELPEAPAAPKP